MSFTKEEFEAWCLCQTPYASKESWAAQPPESDEQWNQIVDLHNRETPFICQHHSGIDVLRSTAKAAERIPLFRALKKRHPHLPVLLLLQSECHFLLNDAYGALCYARKAARMMRDKDPILDKTIEFLEMASVLGSQEDEDYADYTDDDGLPIVVHGYQRPADFVATNTPFDIIDLPMKWKELQEMSDGAEQFFRYALVETNEIEDVFCLSGESTMKLALWGWNEALIEGIASTSKVKNKKEIISILQQTQKCFDAMKDVFSVANPAEVYSEQLITDLHYMLLEGRNIEVQYTEDGPMFYYVPGGRYRRVPCYAMNEDKDGKTHETCFCPSNKIKEDMKWHVRQVRGILCQEMSHADPFEQCAWIHWAFTRIHPFADGNGRVGRLLASIPLLRANLPPVFVSTASKDLYLQALAEVDKVGDIHALSTFLQNEMFAGIQRMLDYTIPTNAESSQHNVANENNFVEEKNRFGVGLNG